MKNIENKNTIEDIIKDPALREEMKTFVQYVQNTPFSTMFPKKHELTMTHLVKQKTQKLYQSNPDMPIKQVITLVFEPLTDDIPAPLALKLTKTIIDTWVKLSGTLSTQSAVAVAI